MNSSENITRSAPKAAASARAARSRARLPAMSPTVGLICARPITRRFAGDSRFMGGPYRRQASLCGVSMAAGALDPLRLEKLGDKKCDFDRLLGIKPWIAIGMIAVAQIGFRYGACAADTFGDILSGHLKMHAARISSLCPVDGKECADLAHDPVEGTRLVAARRLDRVAMHRITGPNDAAPFPFHGPDEFRQAVRRLLGAKPADQGQAAGFIGWIQNIDEPQQFIGRESRAAFETDRILHAPHIFHMGMAWLAGAVANPNHMA